MKEEKIIMADSLDDAWDILAIKRIGNFGLRI